MINAMLKFFSLFRSFPTRAPGIVLILAMLITPGCSHSQQSRVIDKPQIERGRRIPPLDLLASALGLPNKLLLWNWKFANHNVSSDTEEALKNFLTEYELTKVKVRINQFAPFSEVKRIITNKEVGVIYRIIAIPFSFFSAATGRLLAGLLTSDYYDPFSNTIHIFSDDVAIALHEAGHAKDFEKQRWKGSYAMVRMLPGVNLAQELVATHEAFDYLEAHGSDQDRIRAPAVLYPAFSTYVGSYLQAVPLGSIGALLGGHLFGRLRSRYIREELEIIKPLPLNLTQIQYDTATIASPSIQ